MCYGQTVTEAGTSTRPNFLFILTDDQGPWATSTNWPELVTPAIDALEERSVRFDNCYCASPVCSPSRASLMTGRMPSAHGVHDWLVGEQNPHTHDDDYLGGMVTLPQALHHAGYTCAMSGKWHVGTSRFPAPGFDFWYAHRRGGGPYYGAPIWDSAGAKAEEPRYFSYAVTEEACAFLDQVGRKRLFNEAESAPFYLQVNFTAPHDPWINSHPADLYALYDGCTFPSIPREEPHPWTRPRRADFEDAFANPVPFLQGYAAAISGVDRCVGVLLDRLEANGFADNTVIIYMSDNGFSCGQHGLWGKGNGTFPLNFWENSVRVPFLVSLPGMTGTRVVSDHVSSANLYEAVCNLAGVEAPEDPLRVTGALTRLLSGEGVGDESVVVYDEYGGGRMIRSGEWKLVDRWQGPRELYNLDVDPGEVENQAGCAAYAAVEAELADRLHEWFAAHETAMARAFDRGVTGRGQIQPPYRMLSDEATYGPMFDPDVLPTFDTASTVDRSDSDR